MNHSPHILYEIVYLPAIKAMKGNRGRMVSQGGHGFLHAFWDAQDRFPHDATAYRAGTAFKVVLQCDDEDTLRAIHDRYRPICGVSMVIETGSRATCAINAGAQGITGLGIGPIRSDLVGNDIRALRPFL